VKGKTAKQQSEKAAKKNARLHAIPRTVAHHLSVSVSQSDAQSELHAPRRKNCNARHQTFRPITARGSLPSRKKSWRVACTLPRRSTCQK
jgi:hypothetical protein